MLPYPKSTQLMNNKTFLISDLLTLKLKNTKRSILFSNHHNLINKLYSIFPVFFKFLHHYHIQFPTGPQETCQFNEPLHNNFNHFSFTKGSNKTNSTQLPIKLHLDFKEC